MTRNESRSRLLIAAALGLANIGLVSSLAAAGLGVSASAKAPNLTSTSSAD